jgi:ABC-type tungstate transport system permease subunit
MQRSKEIVSDMLTLRKPTLALIAAFCSAVFSAGYALAQEKSIVVVSTTSTKDTGLFEHCCRSLH